MSREQNGTPRSECTHVWMICSYMQDLQHQGGVKIAILRVMTKRSLVPYN
jgi:hypothetical protein